MTHGSVIYELAERLGEVFRSHKFTCAVAESCTGGSLSATLTSIPGSSDWFERGYITYSNQAKIQMLGVSPRILRAYGAVSEQTARAMAEGVIAQGGVDTSVAITGIAGPDGGSKKKPVGTVWIAWAGALQPTYSHCFHFPGNRPAIRHQAVETALEGMINRCESVNHHQGEKTSARYFFALLPEKKVADALYKQAEIVLKEVSCTITPTPELHLTLSYLGSVPPDFLQEAMRIASILKTKRFVLTMDDADNWPKPKVCVLRARQVPKPLDDLVYSLNSELISVGFKPDVMPFIPHVTIARKCKPEQKLSSTQTIEWPVESFCLVKSFQKGRKTEYEVIERWTI